MTRESYHPEHIDELTLRVLDVCCRLRRIAESSREEQLPAVPLHDKKALEWLGKLENWLHKAEAELQMAIIRNRGARRAQTAALKEDRQ